MQIIYGTQSIGFNTCFKAEVFEAELRHVNSGYLYSDIVIPTHDLSQKLAHFEFYKWGLDEVYHVGIGINMSKEEFIFEFIKQNNAYHMSKML